MGAPMTARLAAAFPGDVLAWDPDKDRLEAVARDTGAQAAASVAEIAAQSDILFSCVPDNAAVRALYLGPDGIGAHARPGTVTIDCSTVGPDATQDVHAGLKAVGVDHLDAAMLGSVKQANEGTISFVVGGEAAALETAHPALMACGQLIRHCGPSGAGNQMKLIHQTLVAGHAVAVAEALGLCLETGVDVDAFYEIVTQGTGFAYSRYFENRVPRMSEGTYDALFMLRFMLKDARLARDMAGSAYPVLNAVVETLEEADAAGHGGADFSAAMKAIEARIGRKLGA